MLNVTPSPPPHYLSLLTMSSYLPAGDQLVVRGGNAHFFTYTQEYDRGRQEKIERQTNKLGVTKCRGRCCNTTCMCIPYSRWYGLTLAWVTSENSTMLLESDILRLFFTGPFLSPRLSVPVSGVDCPSVLPRQLLLLASLLSSRNSSLGSSHHSSAPVQLPTASLWSLPLSRCLVLTAPPWIHANCLCSCPTTNCLCSCPTTNYLSWSPATNYQLPLSGSRRQLSFASPYRFRVRRDFMSKNPLSGFAPKQTIESSALAAYPHSATVILKNKKIVALSKNVANF